MEEKVNEFEATLSKLESLIGELKETNTLEQDTHCLGDIPYRVIHFKNNPADEEIKAKESEYEAIKKENERLRARLSLLELGNNADVTRRIDEAVNNAHQIEVLTQKVAEYKNREEKILSSLRKTAGEFRQACYSLIGYRVDALKDNIYRLSHRDAESEDDKLFFKVERDGGIRLLRNQYSERYSRYVSTYLENADSFPAFLAAVTLDYFKSSTQLVDMSMSMSTTIQPNPNYIP